MEHEKSAVRCKVEHPFLIVKKQMGYAKVVYRGIAKNMNRFHMLFASANLRQSLLLNILLSPVYRFDSTF